MQIAIKWDSGTEYLAIDLHDPDANEVREIAETREWWPRTLIKISFPTSSWT